ncbi:MAG: 4-(cytidine 5'-diphospho)-2-C-methyl-D-erythritol kinase [Bryobacteraceae bacterium]
MDVTVPSLAKINLDLRVLFKRNDGYHELRSLFQTISLKDAITIQFESARRSELSLDSSVEIADNLVLRAARLISEELNIKARIRFRLRKKIPMGAGLGGGSSNAAAVLIAVAALSGKRVPIGRLIGLAEKLGSDVPFFLLGGTAVAIGRGTELYPLADQPRRHVLVISTGVHVSTATAYGQLARQTIPSSVTSTLTSPVEFPILREFQTITWTLDRSDFRQFPFANDFEKPVFETHRQLPAVVRKLRRAGAMPVRMTGSGSAVFGIFETAAQAKAAAQSFPPGNIFLSRFVDRGMYRRLWTKALGSAAGASCFANSD